MTATPDPLHFVTAPRRPRARKMPLVLAVAASLRWFGCAGETDAEAAYSPDADGDGWTVADGDCDDGNESANPGELEACGDGLDRDCDGTPGDCHPGGGAVEDARQHAHGLPEGYEFGTNLSPCGDLDGDGDSEFVVYQRYYYYATSALLVYPGTTAETFASAAELEMNGALAFCGFDLTGDGKGDLVFSSDDWSVGVLSGDTLLGLADGWGAAVASVEMGSFDWLYATAGTNDVDGDGIDDVLAWAGKGEQQFGALVSGSRDLDALGVGDSIPLDSDLELAPAGDLDADGRSEILVRSSGGGTGAYLLQGGADLAQDLADTVTLTLDGGALARFSCAGGDLNGDGTDDLLLATDEWAYLVAGGRLVSGDVQELAIESLAAYPDYETFELVSCTGDVDDDGSGDILVEGDFGDNGGRVALLLGAQGMAAGFDDAVWFYGSSTSIEAAGGAGDVDGDGTLDMYFGQPGYGEGGALHVIHGVGW